MENYNNVDRQDLKIESKNDIKNIIDKSTDYQELYDNSLVVLRSMEKNFKITLWHMSGTDVSSIPNWNSLVSNSVFDDKLNTDNPVTIFEKKGADLLNRSKDIAEKSGVKNAAIQIAKAVGVKRLDARSKQVIIDELWSTRVKAIEDFKKDAADGVLSNANNISFADSLYLGQRIGDDIFYWKQDLNHKEFEQNVAKMDLNSLMYGTFNIYEGSGAFNYCYGKIKEKLGNRNLFDYIDSQNKGADKTGDILKYSALNMLFLRRKTKDLCDWINSYHGDKGKLKKYIRDKLYKDSDFKISFLTSIKELEKSGFFKPIIDELKQKDPKVKEAYDNASKIDNADVFRMGKVNGLMLYDDEGHGGGSAFFDADLQSYRSNGYSVEGQENTGEWVKYVLKKGNNKITMVKLKVSVHDRDIADNKVMMKKIIGGVNYNLFALRGHCYNTDQMAMALGSNVEQGDILIDGGCWNASKTGDYYGAGVKGHVFAYTSEGRGASTQSFINRIIQVSNSGGKFSDALRYYDALNSESGADGYFAFNVERPDSVAAQYKQLQS